MSEDYDQMCVGVNIGQSQVIVLPIERTRIGDDVRF